jgi:hypothetical protein
MGARRSHHDRLTADGWAHSPSTVYTRSFHSGFFGLLAYVPEFGWGWSFRHRDCSVVLASGFVRSLLQARACVEEQFESYKIAARGFLEHAQGQHVLAAQALRTRAGASIDSESPYKALLELIEDADNWYGAD